ncbi:MAG TPA: DUF222 domain-containing protein [Jiangellaceae bacterium]
MAAPTGGAVLGIDNADGLGLWVAPEPRRGLLGPDGEPLVADPVAVAQRLEAMISSSGEPLFPHVDARVVAEDEGYFEWRRSAAWRTLQPGPDLAYELTRESLRNLPTGAVVEVAQAHSRLIAHHEALMSEALAELASRPEYARCSGQHEHDAVKAASSEVSLALSWTPAYADARVREAQALARELPATLDALHEGRIDAYQARVICDETEPLADQPEQRAAVEQAALRVADRKTGPALRTYVKREVLRRAPEHAEQRRRNARATRRIDKPFVLPDGMAQMQLLGPIEDLAALFTAVDAAARARRDAAARATTDSATGTAGGGPAHPDAGESLETLRFDVLAGVAWTALHLGHLGCCAEGCANAAQRLGSRHGRAATLNLTVPFTTLIGIDDEPGVLHGYGLIHPVVARRIAAEATWRRVLTDPTTGAVLDYGTTKYAPPRHLAEHVIARDVTCRFPTCIWTAEACELDHTVPFKPDGTGGPTSHANLGAFHDRHHYDKTHHGFGVRQPSPGEFVINTPAGLTYHVDPEIVGPVAGQPVDESSADPPPDDDRSNEDGQPIGDIEQPDDPPF